MATQQTFDQMFGGATTDVDYRDLHATGSQLLPAPDQTDNLMALARKLRAIADVVEAGRSAAVATGFKGAAQQERDPEKIAQQSMTAKEEQQYNVWVKGIAMPAFDWDAYRDAPPSGKETQKRYGLHAQAMNRVWATDKADIHHAVWLFKNWSYAIPLITAVEKVIGAERGLHGGLKDLNDFELAEIQTIHKYNSVAAEKINETYAELNKVARDINQSKSILQAREHALKRKIEGYKPKRDLVNDERRFVGLAPIGAEFDYRGATSGGRSARTDLLGGTGLPSAPTRGVKRVRVGEPSRSLGGLGGHDEEGDLGMAEEGEVTG